MIIFNEPPCCKKDEEIFIDDVDKLVLESFPNHEGQHPLFKKFGTRTGGFADIWLPKVGWEQLDEVEKWKYVALCALYWKEQYKYWYNECEYKQYKTELVKWSEENPLFLDTLKYLEGKEK